MILKELIQKLHGKDDADVWFDFDYFTPTGVESYRGYNDQLAIKYEQAEEVGHTKLSEFKKMLTDAIGKSFKGYKGGDYTMRENTETWVANHGECPGVQVVSVEDQGWRVVLHTKLVD